MIAGSSQVSSEMMTGRHCHQHDRSSPTHLERMGKALVDTEG